jgi:hypothetical protein
VGAAGCGSLPLRQLLQVQSWHVGAEWNC